VPARVRASASWTIRPKTIGTHQIHTLCDVPCAAAVSPPARTEAAISRRQLSTTVGISATASTGQG
jgi:hypothetical protein